MRQNEEPSFRRDGCPNCQSKDFIVRHRKLLSVYSETPYDLIQCKACGFIHTFPQPSIQILRKIYNESYSYEVHKIICGEKQFRAKNTANILYKHFSPRTVLDCGCMFGNILAAFESLGVRGKGVEPSPKAAGIARNLGLHVDCNTVEEFLSSGDGVFDLILLSHSLEHLQSPLDVLTRFKRHLSPQGHLAVIVPNTQASTAKLFQKYWGYWQVPVHLQHYNAQSLTFLLRNAGYAPCFSHYFGADSLFFLSSLCNILGIRGENTLSRFTKYTIYLASLILQKWYFLGNEDLCIVAKAHPDEQDAV